MKIISATSRVTIGLVCLGVSVWLVAYTLGMLPDRTGAIVDGRAALCENVALNCSLSASRNDRRTMNTSLEALVKRNDEIESAAIRRPDGSLLVSVGPHVDHWDLPPGDQSTHSQMRVPILAGDTEWGTVEVRFEDAVTSGSWTSYPFLVLTAFITAATYLLYFFYLRKMLKHLDPSRVVPRRVRDTLDTLADGLLVLDKNEQILMANQAFADSMGVPVDELTGCRASELPWVSETNRIKIEGYPWQRAMVDNSPQIGELLTITGKHNERRILKVSAMPVFDEDGVRRGAMASFDDVTEMEENREHLRKMLDSLSESRDEIHRQNLELERLAARDSLTDCLNRRAFFSELENHWNTAARHDHPLSFIIIDLDHFKLVNDNHGHQTGDMVLEKTSQLLREGRRPSDLVCRYGGEEFCILLPHTELEAACGVAEQIRESIESADFNGISVTCSLGVSARCLEAGDPQELIDQADKSLYVAKDDGRNRVVRFDEAARRIVEVEELDESIVGSEAETDVPTDEQEPTIPYHAVTALVSALAYRDPSTADHSRRVADLCVATARRLMPTGESYVLEIGALLHDIGKIGVPDSILLKPGKLTDEEWKVMNSHERIGAEIVQSTFSNAKLAETIRTYRAWFGGNSQHPELPTGDDIPLAARILAIADAYDSMTHRTAYREPITREQALVELRRCAVRQFDPELIERFIEATSGRDRGDATESVDATKDAALSFGTQIERLSQLLEANDIAGIATLANRLNLTAVKYGSSKIAGLASQLEDSACGDADVNDLVNLTNELLNLCRLAQRAYLNDTVNPFGGTCSNAAASLEADRAVPQPAGPSTPPLVPTTPESNEDSVHA